MDFLKIYVWYVVYCGFFIILMCFFLRCKWIRGDSCVFIVFDNLSWIYRIFCKISSDKIKVMKELIGVGF